MFNTDNGDAPRAPAHSRLPRRTCYPNLAFTRAPQPQPQADPDSWPAWADIPVDQFFAVLDEHGRPIKGGGGDV